jgi:hypothetical protein
MPTYKAAGLGLELFADPELLPVALWLALVRPHASSVPSDNPLWLATCRATSTTPLSGGVGEAASAGLELKSTGPVETVYA